MTRPRKKWLLAEYWATLENLEVAQSAFLESGAIGIEIDDGIGPENTCKYEHGSVRLLAYFEPGNDLKEQINNSMKIFFANCELDCGPINFSDFDEEDWQGNFVRSCTTFRVEPGIYIVPSFEMEQFRKKGSSDLCIEMDPENAFGTGQHQTTKLCLTNIYELLQKNHDRAHMHALDVGTGSGILAILMKKLGLAHVVGTDTDNDSIITAKKNASRNGVDLDLHLVDEEQCYPKNKYQLVVANILAPVLIHMADNLINTCTKGGVLILSGILVTQSQDVISAYEHAGASIIKQDAMDDWCALVLVKN